MPTKLANRVGIAHPTYFAIAEDKTSMSQVPYSNPTPEEEVTAFNISPDAEQALQQLTSELDLYKNELSPWRNPSGNWKLVPVVFYRE